MGTLGTLGLLQVSCSPLITVELQSSGHTPNAPRVSCSTPSAGQA